MREPTSEWWPKPDMKRWQVKFLKTGEPVGETEWRRWRTEDGWHPDTPAAILEEYGWLFEFDQFGGPHK